MAGGESARPSESFPFEPPGRMGCSSSRSELVRPQDLLTASEAQTEESSFKLTRAQEEDPQSLLPGASEAEPEVIDLVKSQSNVATLAPESVGETVAKELVRRDLTEKEAQTEAEPAVIDVKSQSSNVATAGPVESVGETAAKDEDAAAAVEPEVEAKKEEEAEVPELSWFEAATLGDLKNLSLHVKMAGASLLDSEGEERLTALHLTAQHGQVAACRWLLQQRADAAAVTKKKATALHLAAMEGHLEVLRLLLEPHLHPELQQLDVDAWPTVTAVDLWRCSPLHRAAEYGRSEVALFLLTRRADVQKADREGNSPLHFACSGGCGPLVAELLKRQVPLDFANNDGFSPLDLCLRKRQRVVGDQLVAAGAKLVKDVKKTPPSMLLAAASGLPFYCSYIFKADQRVLKKELAAVDAEGRTPLLLAIALGHAAVVERMLDHPLCDLEVAPLGLAPVHQAAQAGQLEILQLLLQRKAQVDQKDAQGNTMLFHAAEAKQLTMLDHLLSMGLSPQHCNDTERTALHLAAQSGSVEACRLLLQKCQDAEELLKCQDWQGATAVHLGIQGGHADVCRFLMEEKADLQQALDFGVTPLQLAADLGHSDVLQLLLSDLTSSGEPALRGALQGRQGDGKGAWLVACGHGHLQCAKHLWATAETHHIDLSQEQDRTKRKAMTLAAVGGHLDMCKWLLEIGSDVRERDSCLWTPLHAASAEGHAELVEWLLKQGVDVSAVDEDGHTAHALARRRGCAQVEALLRRFAAQAAGA